MAKWAKKWYWREMREAERDSGLQHRIVLHGLLNAFVDGDVYIGVDQSASNADATGWSGWSTMPRRTAFAVWESGITPGPAIIIKCACGASESEYPNQHMRACPQFKTNFCHCPPATGPNQPHRDDCCRYKREGLQTDSYFGVSRMRTIGFGLPYGGSSKTLIAQAQAYNAALQWVVRHDVRPIHDEVTISYPFPALIPASIECTCAANVGVGHSRFCPLGDGTGPEGVWPEGATV
jgi:hypothetical protein